MVNDYSSVFSNELTNYVEFKSALGFKKESFYEDLHSFDLFCKRENLKEIYFSEDLAVRYLNSLKNLKSTTRYHRFNSARNFLLYLCRKGINVYVPDNIKFKQTDFKPHIYTDQEITLYFEVLDNLHFSSYIYELQFPIFFRLLYSSGLRIGETCLIKLEDLDLDKGCIYLKEAKWNSRRIVFLNPSMHTMLKQYFNRRLHYLSMEDYIFSGDNTLRPLDHKTIYSVHRLILQEAKIPYLGNGKGPRIHDWRHTFAVRSFKKLSDLGYDLYAALPILSSYLGHRTIFATERYVRLTKEIYPDIIDKLNDKFELIFGEPI